MRWHIIVLGPPPLDARPRLSEAVEPMHVQALIPKFAAEALNESIVHWSLRCDEVKSNPAPVRLPIEDIAGEFGPVVRSDHQWLPVDLG